MWKFWNYHGPVWSPADEGGSGGEGGQEGAGEGAGEEQGGGKTSILDFASEGNDTAEGGEGGDYELPEGLELPDHLRGTSAEDTLAKVAAAYKGARRELSQKGKGEGLAGDVPETPDGYTFEADGDDDNVAAELNSEASKPIVDAFRNAAHELGIPAPAFEQLMRKGLAGVGEAGIPIGVSNEDAEAISAEAEMEALTEQVGAREAGTIVNTLKSYGQKLVDRGVLQDEGDITEYYQMIGTARAARIFHRIMTGEFGEKPIPPADGADGSVTATEAYAAHNRASSLPAGAERDQAMAEATRMMEKAFGKDGPPAGQFRSSVL